MNKMTLKFCAKSENEQLARTCVSAFILPLNPSVEEMSDVKTAVSEAVTNAVVHAYLNRDGEILVECLIENNVLHIIVEDFGKGIEELNCALEPFFTTKLEEERSGMGFTIMKTFMDELNVVSKPNFGTKVFMRKVFNVS